MANARISKGFTLIEVMLATVILVVGLVGLLGTFIMCFNANETAKNVTVAGNAAQRQIETIRNYSFTNISNTGTDTPPGFKNTTFTVAGMPAGDSAGYVNIDDSNPDLIKVFVSVSWRQKGGRIIGEDNGRGGGIALNGRIDGTEDANGNGVLDSPAGIDMLMSKR